MPLILAAFGAASLVCGAAWADILVLMDGSTIRGTISDRDGFVRDPRTGLAVAIIIDTGTEAEPQERLVLADQVDFVVLQGEGGRRVIELHGGPAEVPEIPPDTSGLLPPSRYPYTEVGADVDVAPTRSRRFDRGATCMGLGAIAATCGLLVGTSNTGAGLGFQPANYVFMGTGGALMLLGLGLMLTDAHSPPPAVGLEILGGQPALVYRTRF